ncbi:hypothetical protein EK21DRAFT_104527 [Setomelanomma holmii]|uniref:Zn(2)-C6 fungal-type domain-containing protein n=1 Tax=Setomelanomma holmii TaxID=210430 RepID=A0A9P4GXW5_9PLEO|nr:hypothetical protein EK21DRAFT_104527 [Setomelanomma holmii]
MQCDRCRRNKSRCDPVRPCSLCVRANVECSTSSNEHQSRSTKRKRTNESSREGPDSSTLQALTTRSALSAPPSEEPEHNHSRNEADSRPAEEPLLSEESRRPGIAGGEVDSAMGIAQKVSTFVQYSRPSTPVLRRTTSAIPDRAQRRPIAAIIGFSLPETDVMRLLLEEYFDAVHWFSLVIYEPRFRPKFESITDGMAYPAQKAFLLLLSVVLGMGAWYRSHRTTRMAHEDDWRSYATSLVQGAGSQLTELMDSASIASVQACILLGSYYIYHGKPNLSFSLLGATIRTAQAIGLHRQPLRGDSDSVEERKRVWWTIYTWDRFASVTYGRPLGINDRECNVSHPTDTYESPYFCEGGSGQDTATILTASARSKHGHLYLTKVMDATERLWAWRRRLPPHLLLDLNSDCEPNYSRTSKVHRLQALSLQLTFDNLLIIFHRPTLAQQVEQLIRTQPEHGQVSMPSPSSAQHAASSVSPFFTTSAHSPLSVSQASSTEQWWDAALRMSKVTQMPQLAQLATDSHLVAFLAINLFNSAIVMAVLALSDPLSDRAQEVKRSITRIFRLQELLGKKTELSMQSNAVLKDVIHMLLQREADAMLAPINTADIRGSSNGGLTQAPSGLPLMSVEDTLRLPIQLPISNHHNQHEQAHKTNDKALRLNESLASVQRAFSFTAEGVAGDAQAHIDNRDLTGPQSQTFNDNNEPWLDGSLHDVSGDFGWADDGSVDVNGQGLYWFWDTTYS